MEVPFDLAYTLAGLVIGGIIGMTDRSRRWLAHDAVFDPLRRKSCHSRRH